MWQARFYQSLPRIVADYPDARLMFLTLTVRNCAIGELGETLNRMNMAFQRLRTENHWLLQLRNLYGAQWLKP